jgi:hypothetical protein
MLALLADAQAGRDRLDAALAGERTRAHTLRDRLAAAEQTVRQAEVRLITQELESSSLLSSTATSADMLRTFSPIAL